MLVTTGSPFEAGIVGAADTLPFPIAHLPAGPLVDRWDHRRILLISELVAARHRPPSRSPSGADTLTVGMPPASLGVGRLLTTVGPTGRVFIPTAVSLAAAVSPAVRHAPSRPAQEKAA
ncbi:hypothetical protein WBG99_32455 [Streptomyces sp. TG1A-60]|uniref:hypothetical protein n=1 Tax=Streptomyces sp. TG1A-60 TaxID=3129111 RepID=UPI0030CE706E